MATKASPAASDAASQPAASPAAETAAPTSAPAVTVSTANEAAPAQRRVRVIRDTPVYEGRFHFPKGTDFNLSAERAEILAREGAVKILGAAVED